MAQMVRICLQCGRPEFDPWLGKISWRREWLLTPIFLPGESPWTEEPDGLKSMGSQIVKHDRVTRQIYNTKSNTCKDILTIQKNFKVLSTLLLFYVRNILV